jgi:hypothetical protein
MTRECVSFNLVRGKVDFVLILLICSQQITTQNSTRRYSDVVEFVAVKASWNHPELQLSIG